MRGKGPTESFERALYMAVEVLLHLPGGGPVITTLLDGASRVKVCILLPMLPLRGSKNF